MWQVTHQVNLPTAALGLLWIMHSAATTIYVPWQNSRERAALAEVVDKVAQTLQLRDRLTELGALDSPQSVDARSRLELAIAAQLERLGSLIDDPQSRGHLAALGHRFRSEIREDGSLAPETATALIDDCQRLILSQQHQLLRIVDQRSQTDTVVMVVRAVLLALGLMVGIGLAMWIARSLRRSLSEISVTLRDAEGDLRMDLGRIDVVAQGSTGELNFLEMQVQRIVHNIHKAAEELQQTRCEMVRAERLAAVGELAAGVAHEIRNPLTSVKLLVQRAAERQPLHSLTEEQLQVLLEEVSRIEGTVQGLLDFARPEKSQRTMCSLEEILDRTLLLLDGRIQQQGIRVTRETAPSMPLIHGDPRLIQQVLVNLMLNALEFMPQGGALTIRLDANHEGNWAELDLHDAGPGISPTVINRLFEPFVTTRSNGSGLGLAISRRLIEEQGGTLTARNAEQGGAVFCVQLPLAPESARHQEVIACPE